MESGAPSPVLEEGGYETYELKTKKTNNGDVVVAIVLRKGAAR
jgi:hypothetical protein